MLSNFSNETCPTEHKAHDFVEVFPPNAPVKPAHEKPMQKNETLQKSTLPIKNQLRQHSSPDLSHRCRLPDLDKKPAWAVRDIGIVGCGLANPQDGFGLQVTSEDKNLCCPC
jgi:hypothetical protein